MVVQPDVDVPFWSGLTGGILGVTALILLTTTYLTVRTHPGRDSRRRMSCSTQRFADTGLAASRFALGAGAAHAHGAAGPGTAHRLPEGRWDPQQPRQRRRT